MSNARYIAFCLLARFLFSLLAPLYTMLF